jgi:tetratricopeptide (TPR) repeat protein
MADEQPPHTVNTITGGIQFGPIIQGRDIHAVFQLPAVAPRALAQLPPEVPGFTGRRDELILLTDLLDPARTAETVTVVLIAGLAGVGKTALAIKAGYLARQRGLYRGGVIFLDLHGYDAVPMRPEEALDALLRAMGVPAEYIPPAGAERAGLYRSTLAQIADPVLIIADDASSEGQLRQLLPGAGPHKVLATSRHTLAGLGARLVDLTVLDEQEGVVLLDAALHSARPGDDRICNDRGGADRLAALCAGLPLALQIVGALLKADPSFQPTELANELTAEPMRLNALRYDDGSGPAAPSVAAAFEVSYRRLHDTAALLFRLMPVNPGPDVSTAIMAILADRPVFEVRTALAALAQAHLIETAPSGAGRWHMHDLLRLYARQLSDAQAEADGREQARDRLLSYCLGMTDAADDHVRELSESAEPPRFAGQDDALNWLDSERLNLVAAVVMAADTGRDDVAAELPAALANYLLRRRRFDDWLTVTEVELAAARRVGDLAREGTALNDRGAALQSAGRLEEAISALQAAKAIYQKIGNRSREARVLANLGIALAEARRFDEAITAHREDLAICLDRSNFPGAGSALSNLSVALQDAGRLDEAITAAKTGAAICRHIGDRNGEGSALGNLGAALREAGRLDEAVAAHCDSVARFRDSADRFREGEALNNFGTALWEAGRLAEAITAHEDALAIFREVGDRQREQVTIERVNWARSELLRTQP